MEKLALPIMVSMGYAKENLYVASVSKNAEIHVFLAIAVVLTEAWVQSILNRCAMKTVRYASRQQLENIAAKKIDQQAVLIANHLVL